MPYQDTGSWGCEDYIAQQPSCHRRTAKFKLCCVCECVHIGDSGKLSYTFVQVSLSPEVTFNKAECAHTHFLTQKVNVGDYAKVLQ